MTSFWFLYCQLCADFRHWSDVFIFIIEQENFGLYFAKHLGQLFLKKVSATAKLVDRLRFEQGRSNRPFFVSVDNVFSKAAIVNFSVPQESILGRFLFLIHINDIPHSSSESGTFLNAGDTCIFYQNKNVHKIEGIPSGEDITK